MGNKWLLILFGILLWSAPIFGQVSRNNIVPHTGLVQKSTRLAPKDDLQAIGSRSIGGKGWKNWYSLEDEISMGHEYSEDVEASSKLLTDSVITEYVNRIGQKIVRNSDAKVPFKIKIIDSDEVNAFALPGGFLYVNSALIMEAREEAELAGVMAHEIAHVAAHHATRQMTRSQLLTLASIPLVFVGGGVGLAVREGAALVTPLTLTRFSRGFEREADYLGVEYLYQAGYDPQAFISFFERIQKLEKEKPSAISKMFSNHPQTADRIHRTQAEIAKILPPREAYVVSTSEFDVVKARLAMLERRSISREKGTVRPSLRRRSSDNPRNSEEDGERPTLKR